MAPNRTRRTKPLPRLTSPFLPASILPPTANSKRLRNIEQEYERMMRNEQVVMAKEAAAAAPDSKLKALEYVHALEDYEEEFGKFLPDVEIRPYIKAKAQRQEALHELWAIAADSCPFNNAAQLEEYFTQVEAFSKDFELEFMVDDDWTAVLEKKRKQLNVLRELERFSKGDPDIQAAFIGWPMCEILVSNPFRGNDMRRVEFDSHLRNRYASFLGDRKLHNVPSTLTESKFVFELPNKWSDMPHDQCCLELFCQHEIWRAEIKADEAEARIRAREPAPLPAPIPAALFYGRIH